MRRIILALSMFLATEIAVASQVTQRALTFEDRVKAQEAIERVYYSHQIGATKSFEQAVPRAVLESKVRNYLDETAALQVYWKTSLTDEMLQRELERMAHGTRMPERLLELYAALGNDPFLVKECLARATLVDRLVHDFYANDRGLHGEARRKAEDLHRRLSSRELNAATTHPNRSVVELTMSGAAAANAPRADRSVLEPIDTWPARIALSPDEFQKARARLPKMLGQVSAVEEEREAFIVEVLLNDTSREIRMASYVIPKIGWDEWWATAKAAVAEPPDVVAAPARAPLPVPAISLSTCAASDTWDGGSMQALPDGRASHTAVWTGSLMVVWGGYNNRYFNTGGRYDPATDVWTPTSTIGAPSGRYDHTAVWTGSSMIVWGGRSSLGYPAAGGRYDPTTDLWQPTSTAGAPSARTNHVAVWTGSLMVVWGGYSGGVLNTGARYDPGNDSWSPTSTTGAPAARMGPTAVVAGSVMLIWGGRDISNRLNTGGRYDAKTDTWTPMTMTGAPIPRYEHTAIWTGSQMVVWGGFTYYPDDAYTGGRYNPASDTWTPTSTAGAPSGRSSHTAVWTGSLMMIWGGWTNEYYPVLDTGARYDPETDSWTPIAAESAPEARYNHTAVWTGSSMVIWGGERSAQYNPYLNSGGRYDPGSDSWTPTATTGAPSGRWNHTAVWTGSLMVVWGGLDGEYNYSHHYPIAGGRYDPATDSWTAASTVLAPTPREFHTAVWTGSSMVVWGGFGTDYYDTGGRYDPISDTWAPTSTSGAPSGRIQHSAVWTGTLVLIFGGTDLIGSPVVGARYDPAADSWTPIAATGAPTLRAQHTAIWTGSRMVVWGGNVRPSGRTNSGGSYDPVSDTWAPTSVLGAPAPRYDHSAIWTGSQMVVWGGTVVINGSIVRTNTGGRYDPTSDTWTSTSMTGAPAARRYHSAVWTGREMVVWGGRDSDYGDAEFDTGGRYDPASDTWAATSTTGAPVARDSHTAVWTGEFMLVWGGWPDLTTGGRYIVLDAAMDHDGDGYSVCQGDCDDANPAVHPDVTEICNGLDDDCNGLVDESAAGEDSDGDTAHDLCDNCPFVWNITQSDFDHDGEGDACDLNDGLIYVYAADTNYRRWQPESGYTTWNSYRGSLAVLRATGQYTQAPGSNPLASRDCGLSDPWVFDDAVPDPGEVAFSLVTGVAGGVESGLGTNSAGVPRANANPCP